MTTEREIVIPQTAGFDPEDYIEVPDGVHDATIVGIEDDDPFPGDPHAKRQLKFSFRLDKLQNNDGSAVVKPAWANQVFSPQSKLYEWYQAITGSTPNSEVPFRTSSLLGLPCRVFVTRKTTPENASGTGGRVIAKIKTVLGPEVKAAAPVPKAKAPLVTRLNADSAPELVCTTPKCRAEVVVCDEDGDPWCEKHRP